MRAFVRKNGSSRARRASEAAMFPPAEHPAMTKPFSKDTESHFAFAVT